MKRPIRIRRLSALLLAVYAAAGLCRTAAALAEENRRGESLGLALSEAEAEIARLQTPMTTEELRVLAWRSWGWVAAGDVVFFDGG